MRNVVLSLITLLFIGSCATPGRQEGASDLTQPQDMTQIEAKAQLAVTPNSDIYSDGKTKLIKTVNYRFEVDNVKKSTEAIEVAIKKYPAYISSSNLHLENPILENKITIRVQNEYFHELLKDIDTQARFVNFRDVKTDDVAKEFVDLESRLKTKREVEERYNEILRKKAGTIEELLKVEEQIGDLHEEIEATISRINYLREQVSYSTINLEFYQRIEQELASIDKVTWSERFAKGLGSGWEGILMTGLILAYLWPLTLLAGSFGLYYKFWKKRKSAPLTNQA